MSVFKITYLESLVEDNGKVIPILKSVYYNKSSKHYYDRIKSWKKRTTVGYTNEPNKMTTFCLELTKKNEFKIKKIICQKIW